MVKRLASFLAITRKSQKPISKAGICCTSLAKNRLKDVTQLVALTWVGWSTDDKNLRRLECK